MGLAILVAALAINASTAQPAVDRFGDPLPSGALFRIGTARLQLPGHIQSLIVSANGKRVAAVGGQQLGVWEVPSGREILRMPWDDRKLLALTPDGKMLAFGEGRTGDLCLLDLGSRAIRRTSASSVVDGRFTPDGKHFTVVGHDQGWFGTQLDVARDVLGKRWKFGQSDGDRFLSPERPCLSANASTLAIVEGQSIPAKQTVSVYAAATGKRIGEWNVSPSTPIGHCGLSPDGRCLAASQGFDMHVWEAATGKFCATWQAREPPAAYDQGRSVLFTPDGEGLLIAEYGGLVRWDWRTGKRLMRYPSTEHVFAGPKFGIGATTLASLDRRASIRLFDVATGEDLNALPRANATAAFSPDSRNIAYPDGNAVVLADATTGKELQRWSAHQEYVASVAFAPAGNVIATGGADQCIRVWDLETRKVVHTIKTAWPGGLVFSPDGRWLLCRHADSEFRETIFNITSGNALSRWKEQVAVAPDFKTVACPDEQNRVVRLRETDTNRIVDLIHGVSERSSYLVPRPDGFPTFGIGFCPPRFSPDGRLLMLGCPEEGDRTVAKPSVVSFADLVVGEWLTHSLDGRDVILDGLAFAPDSRHIAMLGTDRRLRLWNIGTGRFARVFGIVDGALSTPSAFRADGRLLVTTASDHVQVWETASGGEVARWEGHKAPIREVLLSPDGRRLATRSADHTILVWDLEHAAGPIANVAPQPESLWTDLADADTKRGRRAVAALIAAPRLALPLLRERLKPAVAADPKQVARWIDELGSDDFDRRQRAQHAVEQLADLAVPALQDALGAGPALEARRRMEGILKAIETRLTPDGLRAIRAVEILERVATADALRLLRELAKGAPTARLTQEAATALERLARLAALENRR
jgi:WD40 repeat protein